MVFKDGNIPWNKGKKECFSVESIEKLSESIKRTYKENPELAQQHSDSIKKRYKENPEILIERGKKIKDAHIKNPEISKIQSGKARKNWENPEYRKKNKGTLGYKFSEEIKEKIRNTIKETYKNHPEIVIQQNKTRLANSTPEERSIRMRKVGLASYRRKKSMSTIEKLMEKALIKENIYFLQQVPLLDKYKVDFLIEDNICVECDGIYWHNLEWVKIKDEKRDILLENAGFIILRFWENEIKENISECINKIKSYLY